VKEGGHPRAACHTEHAAAGVALAALPASLALRRRANPHSNPAPPWPRPPCPSGPPPGYGRREVAGMLLDAGADIRAANGAGQKPVDVAKLNGEKKMVEWLREKANAGKE
jgi:hypothetical protein